LASLIAGWPSFARGDMLAVAHATGLYYQARENRANQKDT